MTLREEHEDARLTGEEVEMIREVLATCSHVLGLVERHCGGLLAAMLCQAEVRWPGRLQYDVSLAIDHLDFAPPAQRGTR